MRGRRRFSRRGRGARTGFALEFPPGLGAPDPEIRRPAEEEAPRQHQSESAPGRRRAGEPGELPVVPGRTGGPERH